MITINSQLDMTPGAIPVVIHRSQYDSDFSIVFTLFARMGNFTIASGTTAKVRGTKKSGTGYSADATVNVSAKTVTVTGDQQMTAVSGQNIFEIVLMNGTKELCSANFILNVERAALDMDTITDDTVVRELDNLDQFITEAEAAADRAEDAAATFSVDATLTVSGKAADAKKTGDELAKKVDAVSGKGLSTNDYTDEEKTKLAGVETGANKTVIDTTLTQTGQAADAKAVGDAIASEDKKALAAFATDTASGSIASFADGADSIPMKDVKVAIEPVQDLHGYDSPWPAGGGKNKLPYPFSETTKTVAGITFTDLGDGKIKVNGTATSKAVFFYAYHVFKPIPSGDYILSRGTTVSDIVIAIDAYNGDTWVKNIKTSGLTESPFSIDYDGYDRLDIFVYVSAGQTVSNDTISLIIRLATETDATYAPYSNICPISGWTSAKVTRTGKNLCESLFSDGKAPSVSSGMLVDANQACRSDYIPVNGGSVTFSCKNTSSRTIYCFLYGENKDFLLHSNRMGNSVTVTHVDAKYAMIRCDGGVTAPDESMLELGSTVTDYEPYSGQTYSITFPSSAGTVYGGTLDVTKGELVVDRAQIASYNGEALPSTWISDRDVYASGTTPTIGAQVVYKLATPITYTLTPTEITSLLGTNNLWADTGDSDVEYRADTKLYIDKKITEAVSALS